MARETQLIRKLLVFSAATHVSGEFLRQKLVLLPRSFPESLQGRVVHRVLYFSEVQGVGVSGMQAISSAGVSVST